MEEMKPYHFIIPKGFSLYKNSSIIYQTHVIDSMIIHSAGINQTDGTRMSMTLGYHSVDELASEDNSKKVLVRGTRPYSGNDKPRE